MGKFTVIPQSTFEEMQLDAGVILKNFTPATPTAPADEDIAVSYTHLHCELSGMDAARHQKPVVQVLQNLFQHHAALLLSFHSGFRLDLWLKRRSCKGKFHHA